LNYLSFFVVNQVNGNEYEHIWQTPLPKPKSSSRSDTPTLTPTPTRSLPNSDSITNIKTVSQSGNPTHGNTVSGEVSPTMPTTVPSPPPPLQPPVIPVPTTPKLPEEGEYMKYNTDSSPKIDTDRDRPYYIRSKDIYDASKEDRLSNSTGYSTLRKTVSNNEANLIQPADV
jgi:hypothetical protein